MKLNELFEDDRAFGTFSQPTRDPLPDVSRPSFGDEDEFGNKKMVFSKPKPQMTDAQRSAAVPASLQQIAQSQGLTLSGTAMHGTRPELAAEIKKLEAAVAASAMDTERNPPDSMLKFMNKYTLPDGVVYVYNRGNTQAYPQDRMIKEPGWDALTMTWKVNAK